VSGVSRRRFLAGTAALGLAPLLGRLPAFGGVARRGLQVVRVAVSSPEQAQLLNGFDVLCGQSSRHGVDVLLWPGDAERLHLLGLDDYQVLVDELTGTVAPDAYAGYRLLPDYEAGLRDLAARFPDRARVFTLPERTFEGRSVYAIEIASNVGDVDGRPCFYMDGLHHAREWPSAEVSMMFAIDLVEGYDTDERIRGLLDSVRTIVVPIVNPDGFEHSRRAVVHMAPGAALEGYWRKNRRSLTEDLILPPLPDKPSHQDSYGVDANRNYGYHWGGPGASGVHAEQTYRGDSPFSEPESRNVRSVLTSRPVTAVITNHTYGNLVLRPWGDTWDAPPDDDLLFGLGAKMAATNGYQNIKGLQLYATTGTTEDYAYAALGALAYTFEHGTSFHPPFEDVLAIYAQTREAFLIALEAAANPEWHGIVAGRVVGANGMQVRAAVNVTKDFVNEGVSELWSRPDRIDIPTQAGPGGRFELHVGPSTAPVASDTEAYTFVFSAPGYQPATRQVVIGRGERIALGDVVLSTAS